MPWETEGDGVRFTGYLTDLMTAIMEVYQEETAAGRVTASTGVYVTATAIVLREVIIESLPEEPGTADFIQRISDALSEDSDGTVSISTFQLLDDIAEEIDEAAWRRWLADPAARAAIADVASSAFAE